MRRGITLLLVAIILPATGCSGGKEEENKLLVAAETNLSAYYAATTPETKIAALNAYLKNWMEVERRGYFKKSPKVLYGDMLFIHLRLAAAIYQTGHTSDAIRELALASDLKKRAEISVVLGGLDLDDPSCLPTLVEKIHQLDALLKPTRPGQ